MPKGVYKHKKLSKETIRKITEKLKESYVTGKSRPWAKGLTKETDERVYKMSESVSLSKKGEGSWQYGQTKDTSKGVKRYIEQAEKDYESGKRKCWTTGLTKENDERLNKSGKKISKSRKIGSANGTIIPYGGRGIWYVSSIAGKVYLRMSYEQLVGSCLDRWKANWKYQDPEMRVCWMDKNRESHTYYVDFHIFGGAIEYCIETKGFISENDLLKWKAFEEKFPNIPLLIITGEDLWMFKENKDE